MSFRQLKIETWKGELSKTITEKRNDGKQPWLMVKEEKEVEKWE